MHRLLLLTAFFLSACASTPGNSDVDMRAASWQGAPTSELIAVLGEPKIGKSGNLTWRFPGPEDPQAVARRHQSAGTGSLSILAGCASCSAAGSDGSVVTPGVYTSGSAAATTRPRYCTYIAYVEDESVSKIITLGSSRTRCQFAELPVRPGQ